MAIKTFTYSSPTYIDSCKACGHLELGDLVKVTLDGTNPSWPDFFLATVNAEPIPQPHSVIYSFEFDDQDGAIDCNFTSCNIVIECATCCDQLDLENLQIPFANITDGPEAVRLLFDADQDGVIDDQYLPDVQATDIVGLCTEVLNCLDADSDGVIDDSFLPTVEAADVNGLCAAVISCIAADPQSVSDAIQTLAFDCSSLTAIV